MIEGTAKDVRAKLDAMPDDEMVKLMIGRPSLSIIAGKLQDEAAARGMTPEIHDRLMRSLRD